MFYAVKYYIYNQLLQIKQAVHPVLGKNNMLPPNMNSHPELLGWRSPHMSVMQLIVLHPYTKFEVHRPFCSKDTADFQSRR